MLTYLIDNLSDILAAQCENVYSGICVQGRSRSACTSALSLSANTIIGYHGMYGWRADARMIICACAWRFELEGTFLLDTAHWILSVEHWSYCGENENGVSDKQSKRKTGMRFRRYNGIKWHALDRKRPYYILKLSWVRTDYATVPSDQAFAFPSVGFEASKDSASEQQILFSGLMWSETAFCIF